MSLPAPTCYGLIIHALDTHAEQALLAARLRSNGGDGNKAYRAMLRAEAREATQLAGQLRQAQTIPEGQAGNQPAYSYMLSALRQVTS